MKPKAFIFDLDGVLTDTAQYHYEAWKELCEELNFHFTKEDNERLKGVSRTRSFEIILEINHAKERFSQKEKEYWANKKNEEYIRLIAQITPEDILPCINKFIEDAKEENIKLAVASASKNAQKVLKQLGISSSFDYIADANRITKTKPDPEVFLDCCSNLNLLPQECVGFEDAQSGIEAIHAAQMFSVGIGVKVISEKPNLSLGSTKELDCQMVIQKFNEYKTSIL